MRDKPDVTPLGGGLYIVTFPPTTIERIIFGDKGKPVMVEAKDEKQAVRKALRKLGRR